MTPKNLGVLFGCSLMWRLDAPMQPDEIQNQNGMYRLHY